MKKCPYCDFNSHELGDGERQADYAAQLIKDLELELARSAASISSVFFGGGTPSLMPPEHFDALLAALTKHQELPGEITLEANPGTADAANFQAYRQSGANRISIGAQSFETSALKALGRIHERDDISKAFHLARDAGFNNINLDLMHGLPDQTLEAALADLDAAIALGPEHISWYQLTIERNTVFYSTRPQLPNEEVLDTIAESGAARLHAAGYEQYEISAWSKPGRECQHNLNYWQFGDYLGIGAGAHGKVSQPGSPYDITRTRKTRLPKDYLAKAPQEGTMLSSVPVEDIQQEFLMNALRLNRGFSKSLFEARTGLPASSLDNFVSEGLAKGLIEVDEDTVLTTELGRRFLDTLLSL